VKSSKGGDHINFLQISPLLLKPKMPLYDTALQEKPVVLEIGTAYTKLGFAAEQCPRHIIPTKFDDPVKGQTSLFNFEDADQFYHNVVAFLQKVFFKYILVNPKDRKIVLVESVLCPTQFREAFARALFLHFEVNSIYHVPLHLVSLSSLAIETALVVDIGFRETTVLPIFSGVQMVKAWEAQPLGAEAVHDEIKGKLIMDGIKEEYLTEKVVEDIKTRACFVTNVERAKRYRDGEAPTPPKDADYPVKGEETIKIPGLLRETAFEKLFPEDEDRLGLPYIILDAILKLPMDMRKEMAENIFLIGGTSMAVGLVHRLQQEILEKSKSDWYKQRCQHLTFKFHSGIAQPNFSGWLGGSIYGATDLVNSGALSRETYLKDKRLPDITNNYGESRSA